MKWAILAIAMIVGSTTTAAAADLTKDQKEQVNQLIEAYIKENPGKIYENINTYLAEKQQQDQKAAMEQAFNNPVEVPHHDYSPTKGPKDAPVTINMFAEFECPYCQRALPILEEVEKKYGDKVKFVFHNLPLDFHEQALPAAKAAMAANMQGKFWPYYEQLFANQRYLSEELYTTIAEELKLDMKKFNRDRAGSKVAEQISTDQQDAQKVGARGTPFFVINGVPISGAQPVEQFSSIIDRHLEKAAN